MQQRTPATSKQISREVRQIGTDQGNLSATREHSAPILHQSIVQDTCYVKTRDAEDEMSNAVVQATLALTVAVLVSSIWVIFRLRRILHQRPLRLAWACLGGTLIPAVFGCLLFLHTNDIEGSNHHEDWLVAFTLLVSAGFMLGVCLVSLSTARDLARIDNLERAAFFDPITNVYTRGHIDSLLATEYERSISETIPLSVLMLDIDDFKFINDCFGHRAGDHVLNELGKLLKASFCQEAFVGRYGGEEFLVVSPGATPVTAEVEAQRILLAISDAQLEFEGHAIPVTVSIGVKTTFTFRESAKELVADADSAMYEAKRSGRNRVVVADRSHGTDFISANGNPATLPGQA